MYEWTTRLANDPVGQYNRPKPKEINLLGRYSKYVYFTLVISRSGVVTVFIDCRGNEIVVPGCLLEVSRCRKWIVRLVD